MPEYPRLTGADLYGMRCGVLHQGKLGHPNMQYARILFTLSSDRALLHNNVIGLALNLDAVTFCRDMVAGVARWYAQERESPYVKRNLPDMLQVYPNGLAPYIVGMPIIS